MFASVPALLAQQPTAAPTGPTTGAGSQGMVMLIGLMLFFVVFMVFSTRSRRKEQKQRQELLSNLSKNDRVMTIGGIIGTVVQVRDNEVVLKVDEASNTKMTFLKKAIQQVLKEGDVPTMGA